MLRKPVADTQKRVRIIADLAALVDFKFHAVIALAVAKEDGVGFIAILVNGTLATFLVTAVAIYLCAERVFGRTWD